jgi:hypothetical protein
MQAAKGSSRLVSEPCARQMLSSIRLRICGSDVRIVPGAPEAQSKSEQFARLK